MIYHYTLDSGKISIRAPIEVNKLQNESFVCRQKFGSGYRRVCESAFFCQCLVRWFRAT